MSRLTAQIVDAKGVMSLGSRSNSLLAAYLQIILVYPKMQTGLFGHLPGRTEKDNLQLNHQCYWLPWSQTIKEPILSSVMRGISWNKRLSFLLGVVYLM